MFDQIMKKFNKRKNLQSIKTDIPIFNVLSFDMITMVKLDFISLTWQFVPSSPVSIISYSPKYDLAISINNYLSP